MRSCARVVLILFFLAVPLAGHAVTWYVRPDGGTRYSPNVSSGQCDGKSDAAYSGHGKNQHCAFRDFRYLWDDDSGRVGAGQWVIAGGDTIIIRGCKALATQHNKSDPHCRIGWDGPTGPLSDNWCFAVGSYTCYNPPIPAGTPAQHTRILGENYAACNTGGATNPKQYADKLTQLFGGFSLADTINLQDTHDVDIQCIELTTHNGVCTRGGSPADTRECSGNQPLDDYAQNGFLLNNKSADILFQDVYIHGFNSSAFQGPIGGSITLNRVFAGFNGFSGWNFDDGRSTPDAPGSSINAHYVAMIGNGCYEEYPVQHEFSARACYDDDSGGFGDAWSGQDTDLDSFLCDHCLIAYNTKDGFIGPHTNIKSLTIVDSESYGNMGAQWKWNNAPGGTVKFVNNITVGDCSRLSEPIPGAAHSFDSKSGYRGAHLSDYCRAGANTIAINSQRNSTVLFANSTFVDDHDAVFLLGCGRSANNRDNSCGSTSFTFENNIFLGYSLRGSEAPGLFYIDDRSIKVTARHNLEFGDRLRFGVNCSSDNICADPLFVNEPIQQGRNSETFLDNFDFYPSEKSPALGHGIAGIVTTDFSGRPRPAQPAMGALEKR